jgi:hypothetical protein
MGVPTYTRSTPKSKSTKPDRAQLGSNPDSESYLDAYIEEKIAVGNKELFRTNIEDTLLDHIGETRMAMGDLNIDVRKPGAPAADKQEVIDETLGLDKWFPVQNTKVAILWEILPHNLEPAVDAAIHLIDWAAAGDPESVELMEKLRKKVESMKKTERDQADCIHIEQKRAFAKTITSGSGKTTEVTALSYLREISELSDEQQDVFRSINNLNVMLKVDKEVTARLSRQKTKSDNVKNTDF